MAVKRCIRIINVPQFDIQWCTIQIYYHVGSQQLQFLLLIIYQFVLQNSCSGPRIKQIICMPALEPLRGTIKNTFLRKISDELIWGVRGEGRMLKYFLQPIAGREPQSDN